MRQGLFQQQTTKLVMTTELRQAISLLQFSALELAEFLQEQAVENPLLNIETFNNEPGYIKKKAPPENQQPFSNISDQSSLTIHDHLLQQMGLLKLANDEKQIIKYLILSIDQNGYFVGNLEEISKRFSAPISVLEIFLEKIQGFDPIGVGARNLQECLLIQLKNLQPRDLVAETIVSNYLQQLADRKWKEISHLIKEPIERIQEVFDLIQTLKPRPASLFTNENPRYIVPDMIIKEEQDELTISFNNQLLPKIKIEESYESFIQQKDHEVHPFLKEKLDQVHFIKRALEQRVNTMKNVMLAIIEKQSSFFYEEKSQLKPLTMKEIAEAIGIHESTVSRTVNGKYVQTPKGIFELKYFFSASITTNNHEENASSEAVKAAIKVIIDEENKKKPMSDQKISDILADKYGYQVSRRTIAKYRDQLGILSSSKRKRY